MLMMKHEGGGENWWQYSYLFMFMVYSYILDVRLVDVLF